LNVKIKIKTCTKSELALMYNVDIRTFINWLHRNPRLQKLKGDNKKLFSPAEVTLIFAELGRPED